MIKKVGIEVAKALLSLVFGYLASAVALTPAFLILWLAWSWDAAVHLVSLVWSLVGLGLAFYLWNET